MNMQSAVEASQILFGKGTTESLKKMNESTFLSVFEGVPSFDVKREILSGGIYFYCSLCRTFTGFYFKRRAETDGSGRRCKPE